MSDLAPEQEVELCRILWPDEEDAPWWSEELGGPVADCKGLTRLINLDSDEAVGAMVRTLWDAGDWSGWGHLGDYIQGGDWGQSDWRESLKRYTLEVAG